MTSPKSKEQVVPEYPADIPEQATEAARAFLRMSPCYPEQFQLVDAFCRAILAERERCASILEDDSQWTFAGTKTAMAIFEDVRELAAEAIRRPTHPKGGEE